MSMANIGTIGYLSSLKEEIIEKSNNSDVVKAQLKNPDIDMFTGIRFDSEGYTIESFPLLKETIEKLQKIPGMNTEYILDAVLIPWVCLIGNLTINILRLKEHI